MLTEKNSFSFGRYLQTFRIESGKSIEDISRETRIGVLYLTAIENEQIDRLPHDVFVKGFLRSFSRAVNADGNEAVRRYLASVETFVKKDEPGEDPRKRDGRFWKKIILLSGILLSIIIFSVSMVSFVFKSDSGGKTGKQGTSVREKSAGGKGLADKPGLKTDSVGAPEDIRLEISAVKDTWMKVIIDGQNPREYVLNSGDMLELKALKGFNLLAGDAGAIRLNLNGRALDIPRESGRAANIQIP